MDAERAASTWRLRGQPDLVELIGRGRVQLTIVIFLDGYRIELIEGPSA
jgi:hypothetical protein